jgi:hypothetical protein
MFRNRTLLIATKHGKEKVIAPILERELGVTCIVTPGFDTDQFGTFAGEVERTDDPLSTARKKCLLAMQAAQCDMAVASEGSFGPHPSLFFIPADDEILIFIDKKNGLEVAARNLSTDTNFNFRKIISEDDLLDFATTVQFPSHGLILRNSKSDFADIRKGITDWEALLDTYHQINDLHATVYAETDMRALYNPTRMKVIEQTAIKLASKINSLCPSCNTPGFDIAERIKGLPCQLCNFPTQSVLSHRYLCRKCAFTREELYPHGRRNADPRYCDRCNP